MSNRWETFAQMPISEPQRQALLENQFALQDGHFRNFFPHTDRRIVTRSGERLGRLYIDRGDDMWRLIDISLLPEVTGQGLGAALFDAMLAEADAAGVPMTLHCSITNRARNLYERKGFREVRLEGADWIMERPVPG
ncbi:MAG: GNAT family N-acetyltransferase [Pseudomonadota bacterium]